MPDASSLPDARSARAATVAGVLVAVVVVAVALLWAKWLPYAARASSVHASGAWRRSSVLGVGGVRPGDAPSWHAATSFTSAYVQAVWKALVAALLISAALQSLVPRAWLLRVLNRRGRVSSALAGGLCSTPSMMCTCCTAPVAVTLRRSGVSTAAAVAYRLGNPCARRGSSDRAVAGIDAVERGCGSASTAVNRLILTTHVSADGYDQRSAHRRSAPRRAARRDRVERRTVLIDAGRPLLEGLDAQTEWSSSRPRRFPPTTSCLRDRVR